MLLIALYFSVPALALLIVSLLNMAPRCAAPPWLASKADCCLSNTHFLPFEGTINLASLIWSMARIFLEGA